MKAPPTSASVEKRAVHKADFSLDEPPVLNEKSPVEKVFITDEEALEKALELAEGAPPKPLKPPKTALGSLIKLAGLKPAVGFLAGAGIILRPLFI